MFRIASTFLCVLAAAYSQSAAPTATTPPTSATTTTEDTAKLRTDLERAQRVLRDWPNLARYRADNAKVQPPAPGEDRVVFMGDSITDAWGRTAGKFFPGKPYINRGIGGQTTPQMLIRFRPDVIALKPKAVVILAGTNDIAGNTGPMTLEDIEGNLQSMAELATANGIKVVLCSVMPVSDYHRKQTDRRPNETIKQLNVWIKAYAAKNGHVYLDYWPPLQDEAGVLRKDYTNDGLHPNNAGYDAIQPLAERAVAQALGR